MVIICKILEHEGNFLHICPYLLLEQVGISSFSFDYIIHWHHPLSSFPALTRALVNEILRSQWQTICKMWKSYKNTAHWEKLFSPLFSPTISVSFIQWTELSLIKHKRKRNRTTVRKKTPWEKRFKYKGI